MHVVAALDGERQAVAELRRDDIGPGAERDHDRGRLDRTLLGHDAPSGRRRGEGPRIALRQPAAEALEERHIGRRQRVRIGHRGGIGPVHPADEMRLQMRLALGDALRVERIEIDAEFALHLLGGADRVRHRFLGPKTLIQPVWRIRFVALASSARARCSLTERSMSGA